MTGLIVLTPAGDVLPPFVGTPQQIQESYLVTLTGVDGSVWNLNSGPVGLTAGAKLFNSPAVTHRWRKSPNIPGARWGGKQTEPREILLPVTIRGSDWREYRDNDRAFFAALDDEGFVTITVTSPDGESRSLLAKFTGDSDPTDDFDPLLMGWKQYDLEFTAGEPYWRGDKITLPISVQAPVPWLVPPGPPLYINPPNTTTGATLDNPGDVESFVVYTITGPYTGFTAGIGDSLTKTTTAAGAGAITTVDTRPNRRIVTDAAGNRINDQMDRIAFAAIPPGASVPVTLAVTGVGADTGLSVDLEPLYKRPM